MWVNSSQMPSPLDQREAGGSGSSPERTTEPHGLRHRWEVAHPAAHSVLSRGLGSSSSSHHSAAMDSAATFRVTSEYSPRNESTSQCESSGIAMPVGMALPNHQWHGEKARTKTGREGSAARRSLSSRSSGLALEHPRQVTRSVVTASYLCQRLGADPSHIHKLLWLTSHLHLCLTQCKLSKTAGWEHQAHGLQSSPNQETHHLNHPPRFRQVPLQEGRGPRPKALKGTSPGTKVHIAEPLWLTD